jgi:ubiquinone/menaquinone biosynthesis C-methylase UbiE
MAYHKKRKQSISWCFQLKTLDVGCGAEPKGDVNIDYFINDRSQCITEYDPKKIPNFIRAVAYPLPFRDNSFEIVRASHVLEHLDSPINALREWKRVCSKTVVIYVPSDFSPDETTTHFYSWNDRTLFQLCSKVFPIVSVDYTKNLLRLEGGRLKYAKALIWRFIRKLGYSYDLKAVCFKNK